MKNFILTLLTSLFLFTSADAQRFGTRSGGDNTGRTITFGKQGSVSYKASIALVPQNVSYQFFRVDSLDGSSTNGNSTITISTAAARDLDQVIIFFDSVNVDASRVVTFSTGFMPTGTLSIAKAKSATIRFQYDAIRQRYFEISRATGL